MRARRRPASITVRTRSDTGPPASAVHADDERRRLRAAAARLGAPGRRLDTLPAQLSGPEREALAALGYIEP